MSRIFGPMMQNGYVVRDLEKAVEVWTQGHGVGPFFLFEDAGVLNVKYKGAATESKFSCAIAYSGDLQIELICPGDPHPSTYKEFLDAGYEGLHHVGYAVPDISATLAKVDSGAFQIVQQGDMGIGGSYAYLDFGGRWGEIVELIEVGEELQGVFRMFKDASSGWDGSDPLRSLG